MRNESPCQGSAHREPDDPDDRDSCFLLQTGQGSRTCKADNCRQHTCQAAVSGGRSCRGCTAGRPQNRSSRKNNRCCECNPRPAACRAAGSQCQQSAAGPSEGGRVTRTCIHCCQGCASNQEGSASKPAATVAGAPQVSSPPAAEAEKWHAVAARVSTEQRGGRPHKTVCCGR